MDTVIDLYVSSEGSYWFDAVTMKKFITDLLPSALQPTPTFSQFEPGNPHTPSWHFND